MSLPASVFRHRARACAACKTPCGANVSDPCAGCPLSPPLWGKHDCTKTETSDDPRQMRGLGDAIALVANPIARILRIDPKKCGCHGPNGRQAALNKAMPFTSPKQSLP